MATSGRLSAAQRAAIISGAPIRQTWSIYVPTSSAHTAYNSYTIEDGIFSGPDSLKRIVKAGSRTHTVWNPSPNVQEKPKAARYVFTVHNSDGTFYDNNVDNVYQIPAGYQAVPQECHIEHSIYVWVAGVWSEIEHMRFRGQIIELRHEDSSGPEGNPAGAVTTITCEQVGAWASLRRSWTTDDATVHPMTNDGPGGLDFTWTVT